MTLQWATFIAATIAAVGSVVRVWQNQRSYRLMLKVYKKKRYGGAQLCVCVRPHGVPPSGRGIRGAPAGIPI